VEEESSIALLPSRRASESPEDIAAMAAFLASVDATHYRTGYNVDGGAVMIA